MMLHTKSYMHRSVMHGYIKQQRAGATDQRSAYINQVVSYYMTVLHGQG